MKPLSPSAQSILDNAVEGQAVDPSRLDANLVAFEARLEAGDLGPDFDPGAPAAADPAAASSSAIGTGAKVVGGLLVVGALALAFAPSKPEVPSPQARPAVQAVATAPQSQPEPEPVPAAANEPVESAPLVETEVIEDGRALKVSVKSTRAPKTTKPSKVEKVEKSDESAIDRLEREMSLMSDARRALGRGDARKALELLNQHAREFPKGEFQRERSVSRVTALCALGQEGAAKRVAKRYLAKDSSSVHAQRISQSCAGDKEP